MNMYEISKKNFLTDKRSILFYTASMPDRYRSAANMHANGIYPHEEYFFREGRKGQFLLWWKKSDSNAVVCELEIIYVNIYIYFHWHGVTRAAFFELKRERIALIDGGKIEEERRFRRERGTSVKGWFRCGKTARKGRRMFIISFSNFSK